MKALSLTQPWASAVALGLKQWETRSWPTGFRGEVAIHAAKGFPKWAKEFAAEKGFAANSPLANLPLGAIVCMAYVADCKRTETLLNVLSPEEQEWGDYSDGRFAFKLINIRPLIEPVQCKGALGLWDVKTIGENYGNPELECQIRKQITQPRSEVAAG